ncbi:MAG: recombination protein NinG [Succinivibrionaceae bacterium]
MNKKEDIECKYCGKLFHPARKGRQFCSCRCASAYRKQQGKYVVSELTKQKMRDSHTGKTKGIKLEKVNSLFGLTDEYILNKCLRSAFPGTKKWPADHPIWDCYVSGKLSPREAWSKPEYLIKAINNLFKIVNDSIKGNKYEEFYNRIKKVFKDNDIGLLQEVLHRFTIAKIAPKVTALMPSAFERILEESGKDISKGIYCPMAGFGGIIEGAKKYYKKNNIDAEIEAYDINPIFCKYYGWVQRDVLAQVVETDKTVFVCPPFGPNTERWKGTPEYMYYKFEEWVELIKEHVKAPDYIFVGPEVNTDTNRCGLFIKKYGIQYYRG